MKTAKWADDGYNETQSDPTTVYSTTKACLALISRILSKN